MTKFILLSSLALSLGLVGCGVISQQVNNENDLLERAELAIGIERTQLTIVPDSVSSSLDAVNYSVKDKQNNLYRCYFTSAIAVTSDSICTKISKDGKQTPANSGNCNALLKAAGKC